MNSKIEIDFREDAPVLIEPITAPKLPPEARCEVRRRFWLCWQLFRTR